MTGMRTMRAVRQAARTTVAALAGLLALLPAWAAPGDTRLVDDFRDASKWTVSASEEVDGALRADETHGLCIDYGFKGVSGYVTARRVLAQPLVLPAAYEFRLKLSGKGKPNHFQFKLTDASGENVWWVNNENLRIGGPNGIELRQRQRQIEFAWGPTSDKQLRQVHAIELVVATGVGGGKGSLCFDRLNLLERKPPPAAWPEPAQTLLEAAAGPTGLDLAFGDLREFSGLQLRWPAGVERPRGYTVEGDGETGQWQTLATVRRGAGPLDALYTKDGEARRLRLRLAEGTPPAAAAALRGVKIEVMAPQDWRSVDGATAARAKALPPGLYPRTYLGQQHYWALLGADGNSKRSALLSEDGALEILPYLPSIEPFVLLEGAKGAGKRLVTWADVKISQSLADGYLPLPSVRWTHPEFTLDIDAGADGHVEQSHGLARYTLRSTGRGALKATLLLVVRPWQVNPPQQFLNRPGGAAPILSTYWGDGMLLINQSKMAVKPVPAPARIVVGGGDALPTPQAFAQGDALETLPPATWWRDADGRAEVAMVFPMNVPAGGQARVAYGWPVTGQWEPPHSVAEVDRDLAASAAAWRKRLNRVELQLPPSARHLHDTLRSALAQILLSRNRAALQPGTRSYNRVWVRDGAMMVSGLLRMGEAQVAEDFVDWYAARLFKSGKVPCCVDYRGADPVPENDSHGQFIYMAAELWRHTHSDAVLERHWPAVEKATRYMETLRQSERTAANQQPGREAFYGLMPASISHEGYSAKPMHSYWDDFWALRGYKDAATLAHALGKADAAREFAAWRDEFAADLAASLRKASAQHGIGFVPGAAELGDFDPTSTTVALNPAHAEALLPPGLLDATFERYWVESEQRKAGQREWKDYTPYELRSVGALVRLGQPERALSMLDFFYADQRPAGWNQWAEVVMRDPRELHFLGDMPHAWVASDAIRSLLDVFVHDTDDGNALVIGAGLPEAWLREGVGVRHMPTPFGPLGYRLKQTPQGLQVKIDAGLKPPPGGLRLRWQGREHRFDKLPVNTVLKD
jgi:hypothetical protein